MSIRDALLNTRGFWLRQVSDTGEGTFAGILDTLVQYGGTKPVLYAKVCDGLTWQGQIDPKTPIHSVADIADVVAECVASGVGFVPAIVPRGGQGEAAFHAQIAAAIGCACFDLEYGPSFWDGSDRTHIPAYWAAVRAGAPGAYLINQPDPRNMGDTYVAQTTANFDAIAGQHYVGWATYGNDLAAELRRFQSIKSLGLDCFVTLWGLGDLAVAGQFWQEAKTAGALGFQVFAFGNMSAAQLQWAASLPLGSAPTPQPDPCADCEATLKERDAALADALALAARYHAALSTIQAQATGVLS